MVKYEVNVIRCLIMNGVFGVAPRLYPDLQRSEHAPAPDKRKLVIQENENGEEDDGGQGQVEEQVYGGVQVGLDSKKAKEKEEEEEEEDDTDGAGVNEALKRKQKLYARNDLEPWTQYKPVAARDRFNYKKNVLAVGQDIDTIDIGYTAAWRTKCAIDYVYEVPSANVAVFRCPDVLFNLGALRIVFELFQCTDEEPMHPLYYDTLSKLLEESFEALAESVKDVTVRLDNQCVDVIRQTKNKFDAKTWAKLFEETSNFETVLEMLYFTSLLFNASFMLVRDPEKPPCEINPFSRKLGLPPQGNEFTYWNTIDERFRAIGDYLLSNHEGQHVHVAWRTRLRAIFEKAGKNGLARANEFLIAAQAVASDPGGSREIWVEVRPLAGDQPRLTLRRNVDVAIIPLQKIPVRTFDASRKWAKKFKTTKRKNIQVHVNECDAQQSYFTKCRQFTSNYNNLVIDPVNHTPVSMSNPGPPLKVVSDFIENKAMTKQTLAPLQSLLNFLWKHAFDLHERLTKRSSNSIDYNVAVLQVVATQILCEARSLWRKFPDDASVFAAFEREFGNRGECRGQYNELNLLSKASTMRVTPVELYLYFYICDLRAILLISNLSRSHVYPLVNRHRSPAKSTEDFREYYPFTLRRYLWSLSDRRFGDTALRNLPEESRCVYIYHGNLNMNKYTTWPTKYHYGAELLYASFEHVERCLMYPAYAVSRVGENMLELSYRTRSSITNRKTKKSLQETWTQSVRGCLLSDKNSRYNTSTQSLWDRLNWQIPKNSIADHARVWLAIGVHHVVSCDCDLIVCGLSGEKLEETRIDSIIRYGELLGAKGSDSGGYSDFAVTQKDAVGVYNTVPNASHQTIGREDVTFEDEWMVPSIPINHLNPNGEPLLNFWMRLLGEEKELRENALIHDQERVDRLDKVLPYMVDYFNSKFRLKFERIVLEIMIIYGEHQNVFVCPGYGQENLTSLELCIHPLSRSTAWLFTASSFLRLILSTSICTRPDSYTSSLFNLLVQHNLYCPLIPLPKLISQDVQIALTNGYPMSALFSVLVKELQCAVHEQELPKTFFVSVDNKKEYELTFVRDQMDADELLREQLEPVKVMIKVENGDTTTSVLGVALEIASTHPDPYSVFAIRAAP
jgi:hypothetical protein